MMQPTCREPYAWLQYPYNLLIELASRFGVVRLLAIILEGHAATLARFANLVIQVIRYGPEQVKHTRIQYSFLTRLAVEG